MRAPCHSGRPIDSEAGLHHLSVSVCTTRSEDSPVASGVMSDPTTDQRTAALAAATHTARAVQDVGAKFMLDMDMYGEVAGLGYQGLGFYIAGRGGVLGDVEHVEVFEAMTFFPAETVQVGWETSASVESRADSASRFAAYAARWGADNIAEGTEGLDRLAELCDKVIRAADGSHAPLFAGWRELPEPDGEPELVVHRMNALRELRAARHIAAIREVGLDPAVAFMIRTPYMAAIFGWPEPAEPPADIDRDLWQTAEDITERAFAADLAVLDDDELSELCQLTDTLLAAIP